LVFLLVPLTGLDCHLGFAKMYSCRHFLNWWQQMSTRHLHLDGFELDHRKQQKRLATRLVFFTGAVDGTRTRTVSPPGDFKSLSLSRIFCPEMDNSGLFFHDISRKK
ncbi:MAG: hypothetical protein IIX49_07040, partial [Oscillospiraceae bacterium]|nr:hypothetical protein [Oscillospiraceae bacterium]